MEYYININGFDSIIYIDLNGGTQPNVKSPISQATEIYNGLSKYI